MSSRGVCAGNAVFNYHTEVVCECKMMCEMLCFTIEMAMGGCEGGRCETAVAAMLAYVRLCSAMFAYGRIGAPLGSEITDGETHCNGSQVVLGCRWWRCVIRECHCRFPWSRGVFREWHCKWSNAW